MYLIDLKEICELMRANFSFESERLGLVESVVCLTVLGLAVDSGAQAVCPARCVRADHSIG